MPTMTVHYETEAERASVERLVAFQAELRQVAMTVAPGEVIDQCEAVVLGVGRATLQQVLQSTLQERIEALEKKSLRRRSGHAAPKDIIPDPS